MTIRERSQPFIPQAVILLLAGLVMSLPGPIGRSKTVPIALLLPGVSETIPTGSSPGFRPDPRLAFLPRTCGASPLAAFPFLQDLLSGVLISLGLRSAPYSESVFCDLHGQMKIYHQVVGAILIIAGALKISGTVIDLKDRGPRRTLHPNSQFFYSSTNSTFSFFKFSGIDIASTGGRETETRGS
mgnify:FL=1